MVVGLPLDNCSVAAAGCDDVIVVLITLALRLPIAVIHGHILHEPDTFHVLRMAKCTYALLIILDARVPVNA